MNYVEALLHERFFRRYRLALDRCWESGPDAAAKREIREMIPEVQRRASDLGYKDTIWVSAVPTTLANMKNSHGDYIGDGLSTDRKRREGAFEFLDQCVGRAAFTRRTARNRLLSFWCWPVDFMAMVIVFPVRVLRRAGLPKERESDVWVRIIQVLFTLASLAITTVFGSQTLLN